MHYLLLVPLYERFELEKWRIDHFDDIRASAYSPGDVGEVGEVRRNEPLSSGQWWIKLLFHQLRVKSLSKSCCCAADQQYPRPGAGGGGAW